MRRPSWARTKWRTLFALRRANATRWARESAQLVHVELQALVSSSVASLVAMPMNRHCRRRLPAAGCSVSLHKTSLPPSLASPCARPPRAQLDPGRPAPVCLRVRRAKRARAACLCVCASAQVPPPWPATSSLLWAHKCALRFACCGRAATSRLHTQRVACRRSQSRRHHLINRRRLVIASRQHCCLKSFNLIITLPPLLLLLSPVVVLLYRCYYYRSS